MKTLLIILQFSLAAITFSQIQEWASRYNGPAGNNEDYSRSIAVDALGNVYVTGYSAGIGTGSFDYATIKFNSSGVQQWAARYNGPGNGTDYAFSIVVDGSGNVYVTGASNGGGTDYDYATIKYDASGVQQWVSRYHGPGGGQDFARSIAVDGSGNVYVTGGSPGSGTFNDYTTIKYNSSGSQQWVSRYNGPDNSSDEAYSLALDGSGNVYVTGTSNGTGTFTDYATIKYNSAGVQQWASRYNGPGNLQDDANSVVLDSLGNVYVTGGSVGSGSNIDYATIKYNSSGAQQWAARYAGPGSTDVANSIAVGSTGNVYVTGKSYVTGTNYDYATIKYNSAGVQQWVQRYDFGPTGGDRDDQAFALVLDNLENVYVTGYSSGISFNDYTTIKYNSAGLQQWLARYNGPGNNTDQASSIALDGLGNVYVTGRSVGSGTFYDYAVIKYSQSVGIRPISNEIPDKFSLSQNYPNPFNPVTNIEFSIPKSGNVNISVFDITGREAAVLVNEYLKAGIYKADFDGSNLPSGVYFYTIHSLDFTQTKKMILIK